MFYNYKHSPTYKHGNYTKQMQIKHFTTYKSIEIALKYTKMIKSKKTSKTRQIFDFRLEPKITTLLSICFRSLPCIGFIAVAFQSEEDVLWRRDPSLTYFCPALDPPLSRVCRKASTQVRDHEYFIPTKFRKHQSSGSIVKADYVFPYIYMH